MSQIRHFFETLARLGAMNQQEAEPMVSVEDVKKEHNLDGETLRRLAKSQGWDLDTEYRAFEKLGIAVDPPSEQRAGLVRNLARLSVGGIIFAAAIVFVAGGIFEGHSALFGQQRLLAFLCLSALLVALALFEGLQICVTLLRFKDFDFFTDFKKAAALHRLFKSEAGTRRFLAGRQFFVVFLVFFIARTTTFPGLRHVPVLGIDLSAKFEPLWFGLFDLGLMGAFLVLWVAQLAPQFGANRDPLAFLSLPGMGLALRSSFVIDDLGLTLPGLWFSSWVKERKDIHDSQPERFRLANEEGMGAAALLVRRRIRLHGSKAVIESEKRIKLTKGGSDTFEDESLVLHANRIANTKFEPDIERDSTSVAVLSQVETRKISSTTVFSQRVAPQIGSFRSDDLISLSAKATADGIDEHLIEMDEPTRLVQVLFEVDAASLAELGEVKVQRADPHWPERIQESTLEFSNNGEVALAEYFCVFPRPGEILRFSWQSDEDKRSIHRHHFRSDRCLSSGPSRKSTCRTNYESQS